MNTLTVESVIVASFGLLSIGFALVYGGIALFLLNS